MMISEYYGRCSIFFFVSLIDSNKQTTMSSPALQASRFGASRSAEKLIPKLLDMSATGLVAIFLFTLAAWSSDGTLYEAHPAKSLSIFFAALGVVLCKDAYLIYMSDSHNKNLLNFGKTLIHELFSTKMSHIHVATWRIVVVGWVVSFVAQESKHPDFGFFQDISRATLLYVIPGLLVSIAFFAMGTDLLLHYKFSGFNSPAPSSSAGKSCNK